jgi:hypothetical protein
MCDEDISFENSEEKNIAKILQILNFFQKHNSGRNK